MIINKAIVLNEYSDKYVEFYLNDQCSSIMKPEDYSKIMRVETIKFNDILLYKDIPLTKSSALDNW